MFNEPVEGLESDFGKQARHVDRRSGARGADLGAWPKASEVENLRVRLCIEYSSLECDGGPVGRRLVRNLHGFGSMCERAAASEEIHDEDSRES